MSNLIEGFALYKEPFVPTHFFEAQRVCVLEERDGKYHVMFSDGSHGWHAGPLHEIPLPADRAIVGLPPGTRLYRIVRLPRGWRLWIATRDFISGTYLELFEDGRVLNCTARVDEGEDVFWVRPADQTIRNKGVNQ